MADFGVLHRNELSGTLAGLTRVCRAQVRGCRILFLERGGGGFGGGGGVQGLGLRVFRGLGFRVWG